MILAGDVGGTKCNLALFREEGSTLRLIFQRRLATRDYSGFEDMVEDFLKQSESNQNLGQPQIDAAGFGVAGVVANGQHHSENLPWVVDVAPLTHKLKLKTIPLLNDIIATALCLERLSAADFVVLNPGAPAAHATRVVITAGTGLGEALLFWDGKKYHAAPAEGGQTDFAPRTEREIHLLHHLKPDLPQVSYEEIVSGRGFRRIHEFLSPTLHHESFDSPTGNAAGEITQRGLAQSCPVCVDTLDFWTDMFASAIGNFALHTMALGGIYIAGGIPLKILPKLQTEAFFKSYCGNNKLGSMLARIPISIVLNEDAPMLGAAYQSLTSRDQIHGNKTRD
jgi:glucokinase